MTSHPARDQGGVTQQRSDPGAVLDTSFTPSRPRWRHSAAAQASRAQPCKLAKNDNAKRDGLFNGLLNNTKNKDTRNSILEVTTKNEKMKICQPSVGETIWKDEYVEGGGTGKISRKRMEGGRNRG